MNLSYPKKLIPNPDHKIIDIHYLSTLDFVFLTRLGETQDFKVTKQKSHLIGLSLNLMGIYEESDSKFFFAGENKDYYNRYWKENESVIYPENGQFQVRDKYFHKWISFNEVHCYPFHENDNNNVSHELECRLIHKPTYANFWHFELHWFDEHKKIISLEKNKIRQVPRKIQSLMQIFLDEKMFTDDVPKKIYTCPRDLYLK